MQASQALRTALNAALEALQDDAGEAERRAKAISALARAERDVAELESAPRKLTPEEDEEEMRAELRRRLARYVDADRAGAAPEVLERIARHGVT